MIEQSEAKKKYRNRNLFLSAFYNLIAPGLGYYYIGDFSFGIYFALFYPLAYVIVNYISIHLPAVSNSIFFLTCNAVLILLPVLHVARQTIQEGKNKFYVVKFQNKIIFYVLFLVGAFIYSGYIKNLTFELHSITTPSMQNTLIVGDRILVRYNHYGIYESLFEKSYFGFNTPKKNELVVYSTEAKGRQVVYLKRLVGSPGDTISIVNKRLFVNSILEEANQNYIYDNSMTPKDYNAGGLYPAGVSWNEDNYGPLYIPSKGDIVKIDSTNLIVWKPVIFKEKETTKGTDEYLTEIIKKGEYVVKNNYYFMMGDDRDNSLDSRYTGLVIENEILGRAEFVVYNIYDWRRMGISLR